MASFTASSRGVAVGLDRKVAAPRAALQLNQRSSVQGTPVFGTATRTISGKVRSIASTGMLDVVATIGSAAACLLPCPCIARPHILLLSTLSIIILLSWDAGADVLWTTRGPCIH